MTVFVQFEDSSEDKVIGVFSCDQDPEVWSNVTAVDDDDPRLINYLDGMRTSSITDK